VLLSWNPQLVPYREELSLFVASGCIGCHGPLGTGTRWGPMLTSVGGRLDEVTLTAHLKDTQSGMSQRAKKLGLPSPKVKSASVRLLLQYLKSLSLDVAQRVSSGR
jgi:hypothetical protein